MNLKTDIANGVFEFPFTQNDYDDLRNIVTNETGIMLPDSKKTMMYTRLVRRLREFKLNDFKSYVEYVEKEQKTGKDTELLYIINAMTTNVTGFFRENHHFEHLASNLDNLINKFAKINIWSSACSSGQEPWSIAMVVGEYLEKHPQHKSKINIMATDIDTNMITHGKKGIYNLPEDEVNNNQHLKKWFTRTSNETTGIIKQYTYEIDNSLRSLVTFKQMNLLKPWDLAQKEFHIVFCRNVIIYFSKDTQRSLFAEFSKKMPANSLLYIGHSESLVGVTDDYKILGSTTYVKLPA